MKVLPEDFSQYFNTRRFREIYNTTVANYKAVMSEEDFITYAEDFRLNSGAFELKYQNSLEPLIERYCFIDDIKKHMITVAYTREGEIIGIQFDLYETFDSDTVYTKNEYVFPVNDEWFILWGGSNKFFNYHYPYSTQRYAYDLIQTISGHQHNGLQNNLESYFSYGKDVVAPLEGEVVKVYLHQPDNEIMTMNMEHPEGNAVILKHANDEYSMVAHLQAGSIEVAEGDFVKQGTLLGRSGNSGASSSPHLHFQVMNGLDPLEAQSIRIRFKDYEVEPIQSETIKGV